MTTPTTTTMQQLWTTIQDRKATMPEDSYTAFLFRSGENEILKKIGEEAIEVIIAAKGEGTIASSTNPPT